MKTLRSIGSRSLCAAVLILLCAACGEGNSHCRLCGAPASAYPCIVELSTGSIAELKPADYGTALFSSTGGISLRSMDTDSVTAVLPASGASVNRRLFCDSCLAMLDETTNSGYVMADLYDLDNIRLYPTEAGSSPTIRDYGIQIEAGAAGERIVTVAIKERVSP